jgi:hypothetical protein
MAGLGTAWELELGPLGELGRDNLTGGLLETACAQVGLCVGAQAQVGTGLPVTVDAPGQLRRCPEAV